MKKRVGFVALSLVSAAAAADPTATYTVPTVSSAGTTASVAVHVGASDPVAGVQVTLEYASAGLAYSSVSAAPGWTITNVVDNTMVTCSSTGGLRRLLVQAFADDVTEPCDYAITDGAPFTIVFQRVASGTWGLEADPVCASGPMTQGTTCGLYPLIPGAPYSNLTIVDGSVTWTGGGGGGGCGNCELEKQTMPVISPPHVPTEAARSRWGAVKRLYR